MKIIKKAANNPNYMTNLKQEIRIHKYLKHPYITRLFYFFEDLESVYLILSFAELGTYFRSLI